MITLLVYSIRNKERKREEKESIKPIDQCVQVVLWEAHPKWTKKLWEWGGVKFPLLSDKRKEKR